MCKSISFSLKLVLLLAISVGSLMYIVTSCSYPEKTTLWVTCSQMVSGDLPLAHTDRHCNCSLIILIVTGRGKRAITADK